MALLHGRIIHTILLTYIQQYQGHAIQSAHYFTPNFGLTWRERNSYDLFDGTSGAWIVAWLG